MTHEQRIERLTQLARKVWPNRNLSVQEGDGPDEIGAGVLSDVDDDWAQVVVVESHPRAIDALEAALCVLAVEPPRWAVELGERWVLEAPAGTMAEHFAELRRDELLEAAKSGSHG